MLCQASPTMLTCAVEGRQLPLAAVILAEILSWPETQPSAVLYWLRSFVLYSSCLRTVALAKALAKPQSYFAMGQKQFPTFEVAR